MLLIQYIDMGEKTLQNKLEEFEKSQDKITDLSKLIQLRKTLIEEEFKETDHELNTLLKEAEGGTLKEKTLAKLSKELADIVYVVFGTAVQLGIDLDMAFDLVHDSNMQKIKHNEKRSDGKILKGKNYKKPDMSKTVISSPYSDN